MPADPRQFVVRLPRHEATTTDSCQVRVELPEREPVAIHAAELVDLSRHGAQVRLQHALKPGEPVVIRIRDESAKLDVTLTGTVRWHRTVGDADWASGCVFDKEIGYEVMGELFLSGILDMGSR
jgi:hypothetical protein